MSDPEAHPVERERCTDRHPQTGEPCVLVEGHGIRHAGLKRVVGRQAHRERWGTDQNLDVADLRDEVDSLKQALADLDSEHAASARIAGAMAAAIGWETPGESWVEKAAHLAPLAAELEAARALRAARNGVSADEIRPAVAFHPGEMLRDELDERGMTQAQLAEALGHADASQVSRLCNGRADINANIAVRLEPALGVSAETWMRLQMAYDLDKARRSARGES